MYRSRILGALVVCMEMVTVYHRDLDQLMLTHYCHVGNQPRTRTKAVDESGELVFDFVGGINLDPAKDTHMHDLRMRIDELFLDTAIEDSQLTMIFACCHPTLSRENQLALTLKTLCGFGISEIARALLVNDETIKKRLQRATKDLIDQHITLDPPEATQLVARLDAVHQVLYLIFNEGHSSSRGETAIRPDLCEDAAYLCHLLCTHPHCSTPTTRALMALMLFHAARL